MKIEPYKGPPIIPPGQTITLNLSNGQHISASAMMWTLAVLMSLPPEAMTKVIENVVSLKEQSDFQKQLDSGNGADKLITLY